MRHNVITSTIINTQPIFYIDNDDPVVSYLKSGQLFGYGNWVILDEFIIDNDNDAYVLDCGAHIGTFSFIPAIFYQKNMILIDGAQKNAECLQQTFANHTNVEVHHKILLDDSKKCSFNHNYGPFGSAKSDSNGAYESTTIDEIVDKRRISAIKLDIEGNEPEALLGAKKTLELNKPPMLIEVNGHCLRLHGKKPKDLFNVLDSLNYHYFIKNKNKLVKIDKTEIFPFCVIDIIAIHKDNMRYYNHLFEISDAISRIELYALARQNYNNSNQDCKDYFNTLNLE